MTNAAFDEAALSAILAKQDGVISRQQALACGMTRDALTHRIRPGGPWQRPLAGVYLTHNGIPTVAQKEMAALLHAGREGVLTGAAALRALGITTAEPALFDVLVPMCRARQSAAFVAIHRTTRMPERIIRQGSRSYALAPRALADTARGLTDIREARGLIIGAIQRGSCPPEALRRELSEGPMRHSALLRQVLAEAAEGIRSVAEADFMELIAASRLPKPMFNARLVGANGTFIACPDAWWPEAGVAAEVDSREYHLGPEGWRETMRRHDAMGAHGIVVLHFTPSQIRRTPRMVITTLENAIRAGRARPKLPVVARPAA